MTNIVNLPTAARVTDIQPFLNQFDAAIVDAINDAREAGVPQGLIVALLHGHAHQETAEMMGLLP